MALLAFGSTLILAPAWAKPKEEKTTLEDLNCTADQIAKFDGAAWSCQNDDDTLRDLEAAGPATCADGDIARLDPGGSGQWECLSLFEALVALGVLDLTVFVTSDGFTGALVSEALALGSGGGLTGLEAGDFICNDLADAAGLPGDYVAWLSDGGTDAKDRLPAGAGPWFRVDDVLVATGVDDLVDGTIAVPINITELGGDGPSIFVWTGTELTGLASGEDCDAWTNEAAGGTFGNTVDPDTDDWTDVSGAGCNNNFLAIYCFGAVF